MTKSAEIEIQELAEDYQDIGDDDLELDTDNPDIDVESTGAVGTYLYTAPEVEAGWVNQSSKVDLLPYLPSKLL